MIQHYVNNLVGEFWRLRLICEELLGPSHRYAKDPGKVLVNFFVEFLY